jgi:hypothetical protein
MQLDNQSALARDMTRVSFFLLALLLCSVTSADSYLRGYAQAHAGKYID